MTQPKQGYPVGVAVILRNAAGQVLLGLRERERVWASFGGHLEPQESVEAGALREIAEELGLQLDALERVTFSEGVKHDGTRYVMLYLTGLCPDDQRPRVMEPDKTLDLQWFDPDRLPSPMWPHEQAVFKLALQPERLPT